MKNFGYLLGGIHHLAFRLKVKTFGLKASFLLSPDVESYEDILGYFSSQFSG